MKKKLLKLALAIACFLPVALNAAVLDQNFGVFSLPGTAWNTGTNYVIFPTQSRTGGEALLNYLNVSTYFGAGTTTFTAYGSTNMTTCTTTNFGTITNIVSSTNGFAPNSFVLVQHLGMNLLPRAQYELLYVTNVLQTNQLLSTTAPVYNIQNQDAVYQLTSLGAIPFTSSASSQTIGPGGVIAGLRAGPLVGLLQGTGGNATNTITINSATVIYQP